MNSLSRQLDYNTFPALALCLLACCFSDFLKLSFTVPPRFHSLISQTLFRVVLVLYFARLFMLYTRKNIIIKQTVRFLLCTLVALVFEISVLNDEIFTMFTFVLASLVLREVSVQTPRNTRNSGIVQLFEFCSLFYRVLLLVVIFVYSLILLPGYNLFGFGFAFVCWFGFYRYLPQNSNSKYI